MKLLLWLSFITNILINFFNFWRKEILKRKKSIHTEACRAAWASYNCPFAKNMLRHVHTESELVNRASYRTTFRCLLLSKLATISHSILEFHCIERRERKKKRRRWKGIRIFLSIVYHQDSSIASRNNTERWFTALTISFLAVASNLQRIIRKKKDHRARVWRHGSNKFPVARASRLF